MKKLVSIFLTFASLSVFAQDAKYECSFSVKVETVKTNIFGGSPRVVDSKLYNPCQVSTIGSVILQSGEPVLTTCGVFTDDVQMGLSVRTQKTAEKEAKVTLIYHNRELRDANDYTKSSVILEKNIEIGKEIFFEAPTSIEFAQVSRREKQVIKKVSVICQRKI